MSPTPAAATRPLRWAAVGLRAALWAVAGLWLLAALTLGVVHGLILPRLDAFKPRLETLATRAIGVPVRIGHLEAQRQGLLPVLRLHDVQLLDARGQPGLSLKAVQIVASVPSLWQLGVEQIHVQEPVLDIRRRADGIIEVAGLDLSTGEALTPAEADNPLLDWLFDQAEVLIQGGRLRWHDAWHQQAPLELHDVDLVLRNRARRHQIRLDATPAHGLGRRLTWMADFRSPLMSLHPGRWMQWRGTVYAHLPAVDLAGLSAPAHLGRILGLHLSHGMGALRWWLDIDAGDVRASTLDVALTGIRGHFDGAAQPLQLPAARGRLILSQQAGQWTLDLPDLALTLPDGSPWQANGLQAQWRPSPAPPSPSPSRPAAQQEATRPTVGRLRSGALDLGALASVAAALPLPADVLATLQALAPRGQLERLELSWQGDAQAWSRYEVSGSGRGLSLQAAPALPALPDGSPAPPQRPGFRNAAVQFHFDPNGGSAQLSMRNGELSFPGVFEDPHVPVARLNAKLSWRQQADGPHVHIEQLQLANADLQLSATAYWQPSDPARSPSASRYPGLLRMDGRLHRAKATRIHRYLPLVMAADVRHYLRQAILSGEVIDTPFRLYGDLWSVPFENPEEGDFRITAKLRGVDFAYAPAHLHPDSPRRWPSLLQLDGELALVNNGLSLTATRASLQGFPQLAIGQAQARLPSFSQAPTVNVSARLEGPLAEALALVRHSPLAELTQHALDPIEGQGPAAIRFDLSLPLDHLDRTTVAGQLQLPGNDLRFSPQAPTLRQTRGSLIFSEHGFQIQQAVAKVAGGELSLTGGWQSQPGGGALRLQGQGSATAAGLRAEPTLGLVASLAQNASGQAPYHIELLWDEQGPQWSVRSELEGLALDLPAPLDKATSARWPLSVRLHQGAASPADPATERLSIDLHTLPPASTPAPAAPNPLLRARLQRGGALGSALWRGSLTLDTDSPPSSRYDTPAQTEATEPTAGWTLRVRSAELDADAWFDFLSTPRAAGAAAETETHLPQRVELQVQRLRVAGQALHHVQLSAQRQARRWTGTVRAREVEGQFTYSSALPSAGPRSAGPAARSRLQAQLRHLHLSTPADSPTAAERPPSAHSELPALDVDVTELRIDGRVLGRLQLQASHSPQASGGAQWNLDQLRLSVPEAELSGSGSWKAASPAPVPASATVLPTSGPAAPAAAGARRTALDFTLTIRDADALLQRFGMAEVLRGGSGHIRGQLSWQGPPYALHTPSLSGSLHLELDDGQFLKADPGLAKLLGVLSLQSLPRRLALDFSDVFAQGLRFDQLRGNATIALGRARTDNLTLSGPQATIRLSGTADIERETQDIRVEVYPELNVGTASLIASFSNPAVGLGTLLAQTVLRRPLAEATKQQFHIHGSWIDPVVERIRPISRPTNSPP